MIKQLRPTTVLPLEAVPRLIVTHSLSVVISDFRRRGFPREFHVLRDTGNDRSRENIAIFTNPCAIQDNGVRIYMAIITDYDIFLNHGKRIDSYILADLGLLDERLLEEIYSLSYFILLFVFYNLSHELGFTNQFITNEYIPFHGRDPRRIGANNSRRKINVSPGTTFWRNFTPSIFMK